jgi:hypothetical protein
LRLQYFQCCGIKTICLHICYAMLITIPNGSVTPVHGKSPVMTWLWHTAAHVFRRKLYS